MNKILKLMMVFVLIVVASFYLTGCSLKEKIDEYSSNKVQGYLNIENVTQFSYDGSNYTILEDTISNNDFGEWIGYVRKIAAIDGAGKIVFQEDIESHTFKTLKDLKNNVPEATYIISFLNVYRAKNDDVYLIIEVNGENHKAILNENIKDTDNIFDFKKNVESNSGRFTIVPISKEELNEIDWFGTNSETHRKEWFYNDIYEIYGINQTEKVAVNVNNHYYVAKQIG